MSGEENTNKYVNFGLTDSGIELRQKAIAGGDEKNVIHFTRGALGKGRPEREEDIASLTALVDPVLDVPVKENSANKDTHQLTLMIDNEDYDSDYVVTEMGVFAQLENAQSGVVIVPEVLYGYTYTEGYDYIPDKTYPLYRELTFNTVLSKADNVTILYDKSKIYLTEEDLVSGRVRNFKVTVPASSWSASGSNNYFKTVNVEGVTAEMEPIVDIISTSGAELSTWSGVYRVTTGNGNITVYYKGLGAPNYSMTLRLKVVE